MRPSTQPRQRINARWPLVLTLAMALTGIPAMATTTPLFATTYSVNLMAGQGHLKEGNVFTVSESSPIDFVPYYLASNSLAIDGWVGARAGDGGVGAAAHLSTQCCKYSQEGLRASASVSGPAFFFGPSSVAQLKGAKLQLSGAFWSNTGTYATVASTASGTVTAKASLGGLARSSAELAWDSENGMRRGPMLNASVVGGSGDDSGWVVNVLGPGVNVNGGEMYLLSYELSLSLGIQGTATAEADAAWHHTLSFPIGVPIFDLPEGWTAQAPTLGIIDNRFCPPGACSVSSVPEPGTWLLASMAIALWRRRLG